MKTLNILLIFMMSIFFLGCGKNSLETSKKPIVIVTIPPYADFVEKIAGKTVDIVTILPPGANLHTYEPVPYDVAKIGKGLVWFIIEEPLEKKILTSLREKNRDLKEIDLQKNISLLSMSETASLTSCQGSNHSHHHHEGKDLHTWMSPKIALIQLEMIYQSLIQLIPENADLYKENFTAFSNDLLLLDERTKEILAPFAGSAILVSHPSFGYFCRDFNLQQLSVECEGKDPRPKDIEILLQKVNTLKVKLIFIQKGFNNKGAELIGKKLHLPIYEVDPYAGDYEKTIQTIASLISQ